jgi:hypothetical protein
MQDVFEFFARSPRCAPSVSIITINKLCRRCRVRETRADPARGGDTPERHCGEGPHSTRRGAPPDQEPHARPATTEVDRRKAPARAPVAAWESPSRPRGCARRTRGRVHRRTGMAQNRKGLRSRQLCPFLRTPTILSAAARPPRQPHVIRMSSGRRFLASTQSGLVGSTCRPTLSVIARPGYRDLADLRHELLLAARTRCPSPYEMHGLT